MTRDEFMKEAEHEIDQVLLTHKNRIMNLVMKAWSEGKKNAEIDAMTKMTREILEPILPIGFSEPSCSKAFVNGPDGVVCLDRTYGGLRT